ncbi:MAG: Rv3235 family protein [Mycobacteriales bacterium]
MAKVLALPKAFTLRRAPRLDGPYDDEQPDPPRIIDGSLALAFPPSVTGALPLRLVPPAAAEDLEPTPDPASPAPDPRRFVAAFAQGIAEVLMGVRPPQQLASATTLEVLGQLERNAGRLAPRPTAPSAPRSTAARPRPRVSSVRLCEPCPGVAEVCAVIDTGVRRRALALRLEAVAGRWHCTVLRVG